MSMRPSTKLPGVLSFPLRSPLRWSPTKGHLHLKPPSAACGSRLGLGSEFYWISIRPASERALHCEFHEFAGTSDLTTWSIGIAFGILSSVTTAIHSIIIKDSLSHVNHSALHLAWYANVLSSLVMIPIIVLAAEVPGVYALFLDNSQLRRLLWGFLVTVSICSA